MKDFQFQFPITFYQVLILEFWKMEPKQFYNLLDYNLTLPFKVKN